MIVGLPVSIVRPIAGVCRRESALLVLPVAASSHPDCPHGLPAGMRNRGGCCAVLQHWDIHRIARAAATCAARPPPARGRRSSRSRLSSLAAISRTLLAFPVLQTPPRLARRANSPLAEVAPLFIFKGKPSKLDRKSTRLNS